MLRFLQGLAQMLDVDIPCKFNIARVGWGRTLRKTTMLSDSICPCPGQLTVMPSMKVRRWAVHVLDWDKALWIVLIASAHCLLRLQSSCAAHGNCFLTKTALCCGCCAVLCYSAPQVSSTLLSGCKCLGACRGLLGIQLTQMLSVKNFSCHVYVDRQGGGCANMSGCICSEHSQTEHSLASVPGDNS